MEPVRVVLRVRKNGQMTLKEDIRDLLNIEDGDYIEVNILRKVPKGG